MKFKHYRSQTTGPDHVYVMAIKMDMTFLYCIFMKHEGHINIIN